MEHALASKPPEDTGWPTAPGSIGYCVNGIYGIPQGPGGARCVRHDLDKSRAARCCSRCCSCPVPTCRSPPRCSAGSPAGCRSGRRRDHHEMRRCLAPGCGPVVTRVGALRVVALTNRTTGASPSRQCSPGLHRRSPAVLEQAAADQAPDPQQTAGQATAAHAENRARVARTLRGSYATVYAYLAPSRGRPRPPSPDR